jgi:hypothetical protein
MIELLVSPTMLDALAWTLIHFLWQGSVLGAAAFIALRIVSSPMCVAMTS